MNTDISFTEYRKMQQAARKISSEQVKKLFPLERLSQEDGDELLRTAITTRLSAGTPVFRANDLPKQVFYLLVGEVELITRDKGRRLIKSGTPEARKPMGRGIKGQMSATARKDSLLISFDADMLELFLSWTNPEAYLVSEMETRHSSEWLDRLLQSRGLLRFSEEHIQTLLNRMSEVHHHAGDVVIQQDGRDDYYYIIKNGRCRVTRTPEPGAKEIKLAELRQGDAFGEEALLANTPRSATIVMEEEGDLMRLSKEDFSKLLAAPLLNNVSWSDSHNLIKLGAVFLDIRLPNEFAKQHLPGSVNVPLALLRLKLKQLSHHRKYIVCCNDGGRSAVAAFLLNRHGFDAFILDGGLTAASPLLDLREKEGGNAPESKATSPVFSSMADYWGATVDEAPRAPFEDAADIENINKTKPVAPAITPTKATVTPISKARSAVTPRNRAAAQAAIDMALDDSHERQRHSRLVRSAIALALIAIAAAIPASLEMGLIESAAPVDPPVEQSERLRPTATTPTHKPEAANTTMGELAPWTDTPEDQLSNMVGKPAAPAP
jgi:CRP-like cAMP-binding protein